MKFETMLLKVADVLDLPSEKIIGKSRERPYAEARQILYLLLYTKNEHPKLIGSRFNRERTTVIFGLEAAFGLLAVDKDFKTKYEKCKAALNELSDEPS